MRLYVKIVANNLRQKIPCLLIQCSNRKYIFNMPENSLRFWHKYSFNFTEGMSIFFTRENCQSMGNIVEFFLELNLRFKGLGTKLYVFNNAYELIKGVRSLIAHRMLPLSFYNLQTNQFLLGVKSQKQLSHLYQLSRQKFLWGQYSNEDLINLLKDPSDPCRFIEKKTLLQQNKPQIYNYFKDQLLQIHPFQIKRKEDGKSQKIFFNYICIPDKKKANQIDMKKFQQMKLKNSIKQEQVRNIFQAGYLKLASGIEITLQDIPYQQHKNYNFIILHYENEDDIYLILNNPYIKSYLSLVQEGNYLTNSVIHVIQGSSDIILSENFRKLRRTFGCDVKHIVYSQNSRYFPTQQQLKYELLNYDHLRYINDANKYVGSFMPKIIQNMVKSYRKGYFKDIFNLINEKKQDKQGYLVPYKYNYSLMIAPFRRQIYQQQKKPQLQKNFQVKLNFKNINAKVKSFYEKNRAPVQNLKNKLELLTKQFNPTVIFLGTSSMSSINYRNSSGIMIKIPQRNNDRWSSIIMDCGQGVYSQIVNHFGLQQYQQQLINLKVLFITHKHQDHFGGIFTLLAKRNSLILEKISQKQRKKYKMFLIIPHNLLKWYNLFNEKLQKINQFCQIIFIQSLSLTSYNKKQRVPLFKNKKDDKKQKVKEQKINQKQQFLQIMEKMSLQRCLTSNQIQIPDQQQNINQEIVQKFKQIQKNSLIQFNQFLKSIGIKNFIPVPVIHCRQSFGIIIEHQSSIKISYSGDCRPTKLFQQMAQNSTLLIHEATFLDNQTNQAKISKHSTQKQAITVGQKTKSLMTVLSHFSKKHKFQKSSTQSYSQISSDYRQFHVCFAQDHLQFKLSQMHQLPKISNILRQKCTLELKVLDNQK